MKSYFAKRFLVVLSLSFISFVTFASAYQPAGHDNNANTNRRRVFMAIFEAGAAVSFLTIDPAFASGGATAGRYT